MAASRSHGASGELRALWALERGGGPPRRVDVGLGQVREPMHSGRLEVRTRADAKDGAWHRRLEGFEIIQTVASPEPEYELALWMQGTERPPGEPPQAYTERWALTRLVAEKLVEGLRYALE